MTNVFISVNKEGLPGFCLDLADGFKLVFIFHQLKLICNSFRNRVSGIKTVGGNVIRI